MSIRTVHQPNPMPRDLNEPFSLAWTAQSELLLACAALTWAAVCMAGWLGSTVRLAFVKQDVSAGPDREL
ncbi:MAG: hypothetical protein ACKVVP_22005 [Chloroflexota bacterium]